MEMPMDARPTPKVLIVDDQPRNLDVLEVMLAPSDCVLVRASSADEALLHLLREDFAAIVLDIRMPDMNGIELASLIKQRKRSQHVPILFLTAHLVDDDDVLRGYGVGAVDYLSKPIDFDRLGNLLTGVTASMERRERLLDADAALARQFEFDKLDDFLAAVGRGTLSPHQLHGAISVQNASVFTIFRGKPVGEYEGRRAPVIKDRQPMPTTAGKPIADVPDTVCQPKHPLHALTTFERFGMGKSVYGST
jgi:CheY-like chemotaxis protein